MDIVCLISKLAVIVVIAVLVLMVMYLEGLYGVFRMSKKERVYCLPGSLDRRHNKPCGSADKVR